MDNWIANYNEYIKFSSLKYGKLKNAFIFLAINSVSLSIIMRILLMFNILFEATGIKLLSNVSLPFYKTYAIVTILYTTIVLVLSRKLKADDYLNIDSIEYVFPIGLIIFPLFIATIETQSFKSLYGIKQAYVEDGAIFSSGFMILTLIISIYYIRDNQMYIKVLYKLFKYEDNMLYKLYIYCNIKNRIENKYDQNHLAFNVEILDIYKKLQSEKTNDDVYKMNYHYVQYKELYEKYYVYDFPSWSFINYAKFTTDYNCRHFPINDNVTSDYDL